jgi:transcription initiation factor TFIIH subunit 3
VGGGGGVSPPPSPPAANSSRPRPRVLVLCGSPDAPFQYIPTMNAIFSAQGQGVVVDGVVVAPPPTAPAPAPAPAPASSALPSPPPPLACWDSAYLQQAAHITGGAYLRPRRPAALLQYLLSAAAADTAARRALSPPHGAAFGPAPPAAGGGAGGGGSAGGAAAGGDDAAGGGAGASGLDYRAACFCHKQPVDTGWVCSVCLSIFCRQGSKSLKACATCGTAFGDGGGG